MRGEESGEGGGRRRGDSWRRVPSLTCALLCLPSQSLVERPLAVTLYIRIIPAPLHFEKIPINTSPVEFWQMR